MERNFSSNKTFFAVPTRFPKEDSVIWNLHINDPETFKNLDLKTAMQFTLEKWEWITDLAQKQIFVLEWNYTECPLCVYSGVLNGEDQKRCVDCPVWKEYGQVCQLVEPYTTWLSYSLKVIFGKDFNKRVMAIKYESILEKVKELYDKYG